MRHTHETTRIRALVFDFDGLVLDTESSVYESWRAVYQDVGQTLSLERWQRTIGTDGSGFDPLAELRRLAGAALDIEEMQLRRRRIRDTALERLDAMPGVVSTIEQARSHGMKIAIASSSERDWVATNLERLGLLGHFDAIATRDDVAAAKPAPDVYLCAVARIGVAPGESIAFEDSPNGVTAAKAAGLFCVAVPGPMTRSLAFDHADALVGSLDTEPLATWTRRAGTQPTRRPESGS